MYILSLFLKVGTAVIEYQGQLYITAFKSSSARCVFIYEDLTGLYKIKTNLQSNMDRIFCDVFGNTQ